ncbi:MAG: oxygen-independent coproporphyrinogen III oxidase, partial [Acidimicrobiales bacterium]|nr:oxygen-independent coproporphyrinogen III oxidase [Acidimicrobiales bacterium]
RYTSYPTAPHFHAGIDAQTYASWLDALSPDATLSLYLHVPYCHSICLYCGCHTKAVRRFAPVEAYAHHLEQEIALIAQRAGGRKVTHWHWGGGTPSIIGPDLMRSMHARIAGHFDLSDLREHAIELDPRHLGDDMIAALNATGVNRVSLGVQDFSAHVQEAIGRVQPFEQVADAVMRLHRAGIKGVNIDLMYGLPKQTLDDVQNTARLAVSLGPQRLALFGYAHVPWFKTHQRVIDEASLPGIRARLDQANAAAEVFLDAGFVAIGLDHFARPDDELALAQEAGTLRRNFQGYTADMADALLGLGASSIGRLPQGYVQNAVDMGSYGRAIASGQLASAKGLAMNAADHLRGAIIERLMCDMVVNLDDFVCATRAQLVFADAFVQLKELQDAGVVELSGNTITITERGRPLTRLAAACFDAYLAANQARHSRAV